MTAPVAFAAGFADTGGHWGESSIDRWADYGIVRGVDGTHFKPDASMTRAQMATILSNLMGLKEKANNTFDDVQSGAWYEEAVLKCAAAGIMKGTSDTTASPNNSITREQATVMLARALGIPEDSSSTSFDDGSSISDWAAGFVKTMADRGIVNGLGNNQFGPKHNITRASVAAILDRSISQYANKEGESIEAKEEGITLIAAPNVTVTGKANDVLIAPAADGKTTLKGANVAGTLTVNAPGATVDLNGAATAASVVVPENADSVTVNVAKEAAVAGFTTNAAGTQLNVEGKVETANLTKTASGAKISVAKDAAVGTVETEASGVDVTGEGKVDSMNVMGGKEVTVAGSVGVGSFKNTSDNDAKHGNKVIAGNTQSGGSSGGSSGDSYGGSSVVASSSGGNSGGTPAGASKPQTSTSGKDPVQEQEKPHKAEILTAMDIPELESVASKAQAGDTIITPVSKFLKR